MIQFCDSGFGIRFVIHVWDSRLGFKLGFSFGILVWDSGLKFMFAIQVWDSGFIIRCGFQD